MAPCNNVRFSYRGTDQSAGRLLASLLSDISIEYTDDKKSVSADLAALIVELDKRVITDQVVAEEARRDALVDPYCVGETDPAVHGMVEKSEYSIQTAVPPVHVSDRNVLQWLRAMNVPIGAPITIQFIDDLTSKGTAVTERL